MSREEQENNGMERLAIISIHLHQFLRWSGFTLIRMPLHLVLVLENYMLEKERASVFEVVGGLLCYTRPFILVLENYMLEKERWHYVLFELSGSGGTASTLWISSEVGMGIWLYCWIWSTFLCY